MGRPQTTAIRYPYLLRSAGGRIVSRHRNMRTANDALRRYINKRKRKWEKFFSFRIFAKRSIGYSKKYGGHLVPMRFSVVEDHHGREMNKPYATIVKVVRD